MGFLNSLVNTGNGLVKESYDYAILNLLVIVEYFFVC